jgi:hypothetical protein
MADADSAVPPTVEVKPPVAEADQPAVEAEALLTDVQTFPVPYPRDNYLCPQCETEIPTRKQQRLNIPAKYEHELNQVFKCPFCNFIFSPRRAEGSIFRR